ncbi:MAG: hypothetical protein J6B54_03535 [Clostridia bacterium]|nr:hypothetical protein [Clostridia bacterium]
MKKTMAVVLALVMLFSVLSLTGCFEEEPKIFVWEEIVLRERLPEPATNLGECVSNTEQRLYLEVKAETETTYSAYVQACKDHGFTVDPKTIGDRYDAYNGEGYKLSLSCISDTIYIKLDAPMEVSQIAWPSAEYAKKIPVPTSTMGKIEYENSKGFVIYIANTTVDEYNAYVQSCSDMGFNVDYSKTEGNYQAKNAEGYTLSLSYEGFNIIRINLDCPASDASSESSDNPVSDQVVSDTGDSDRDDLGASSDSLGSDFKEAMDSYEQFMDEYVSFMKKYKANPGDLSLLANYATFMSKYASFVRDFEQWQSEDLTSAELAYYAQVQARVSKKLLEVAE